MKAEGALGRGGLPGGGGCQDTVASKQMTWTGMHRDWPNLERPVTKLLTVSWVREAKAWTKMVAGISSRMHGMLY